MKSVCSGREPSELKGGLLWAATVAAEKAAEKPEKHIPRGLKSARDDNKEGLYGAAKAAPLRNAPSFGAAERKPEKQIPRRLKSARNDKIRSWKMTKVAAVLHSGSYLSTEAGVTQW